MTTVTASQASRNIDCLLPVIDIVRGDAYATAWRYARNNFRHLINRRMKWSEVETFVVHSLRRLREGIKGNVSAVYNSTALAKADDVTEIVRKATNRRKSYALVEFELVEAIKSMIDAVERA